MKTARLELRLDEKDKEKIIKLAKKSGLTMTEFARKSCLENGTKAKPPDEFWFLLDEVYSLFDDVSTEKQEQLKAKILELQEVFTGVKALEKPKEIPKQPIDPFEYEIVIGNKYGGV